jgi:hypothetical protein
MNPLRPFTEHPASVGESYWQHLRCAAYFAVRMVGGGCACFVHAFLPFLFVRTGSTCIQELHEQMVTRRRQRMVTGAVGNVAPQPLDPPAPRRLARPAVR